MGEAVGGEVEGTGHHRHLALVPEATSATPTAPGRATPARRVAFVVLVLATIGVLVPVIGDLLGA